MDFDTFTLVLLHSAPGAPEHSDEVQDAHLSFFRDQQDAGHLLNAGPVRCGGDLRGICLYRTDVETTRELAAHDPAVIVGSFVVEVVSWMVPAGTMSFGTGTLPRSMVEVRG